MDRIVDVFTGAWTVSTQMAPYLLFGFLIAGILHVWISPRLVEKQLGGKGFVPILKSAVFGIPLPLCSCGVIPVAASLRKHGASKGATVGFLLATPQTGVDSIAATYALLGPVLAVFRPVVALITGVIGGSLTSLFVSDKDEVYSSDTHTENRENTCHVERPAESRIKRALLYGFATLPRDIAKPLIVGMIIAGMISTFVEQGALQAYLSGGLLSMVLMMLVGIPFYVCATSSIPFAIGLIHMGASPGAALVFLIAGPATNAATVMVLWRLLGAKTLAIYLATVACAAVLTGLIFDAVNTYLVTIGFAEHIQHVHGVQTGWFGHMAAVVLLVVLAGSIIRFHLRKHGENELTGSQMESTVLQITGMRCSHCVQTLTRAFEEMTGVFKVQVDLTLGRAVIVGNGIDQAALIRTVQALGYKAHISETS